MTPEPPRDEPYHPPEHPPDSRPPDQRYPDLYGPIGPVRPPVRVRVLKIATALALVFGCLIGAYYVARAKGWLTPVEKARGYFDGDGQAGIKSRVTYPVDPAPLRPAENHKDPYEDRLRAMERMLQLIMSRLDALEKLPKGAQVKTTPMPPAQKHARSMLFVSNKIEDKKSDEPGTYILGPGTWLPCTLEPNLNSEIEGYFTVKTKNNVYDSETGRHLLVPQGRSIVAKALSSGLLLGNERIPTAAVTLSLPGQRQVDLGGAPIMDAMGTNGLTGEVNNHVWRLIWTNLAIGTLRGGQQAVVSNMATTGGTTGAVASGITSQMQQAGQQQLTRAQDTRPTITAAAGDACVVLITKDLHLAETRL